MVSSSQIEEDIAQICLQESHPAVVTWWVTFEAKSFSKSDVNTNNIVRPFLTVYDLNKIFQKFL